MRVNRPLMAQGATGSTFLAGVAFQAVPLSPARIMALGLGFLMAGCAGVHFMADQALLPVPGRLNPVRLQSPEIVVRGWLRHLMTSPTGGFAVTDRAGLFILARHHSMPLRPTELVTGRRRLGIDADMTGRTARSRNVDAVTNRYPGFPCHQGNHGKLLVHQIPMTFGTTV